MSNKQKWTVNKQYGLDLITPTSFLPNPEKATRIIEGKTYTRVSAQLIGTTDWENVVTEPHLFSVRNNRHAGDATILYYNEGQGYGYCFCKGCGKMTLEKEVADPLHSLLDMPQEMNDKWPSKNKPASEEVEIINLATEDSADIDNTNTLLNLEPKKFHYAISGKSIGGPCFGSNQENQIMRNVIIGDTIQTD